MRVDLITAGFPCQDVSVAGQRKGLAGERSGLFWEIVRLAERLRPRWLLLENVPGLFSSHRGRDFGVILTALDELGYGVAWASLDAQWRGLAQRRNRVFLVGHLGAPCPAEILFEPKGMSGDTPPRREAGKEASGDDVGCLNSGGNDGGFRTEPGEHLTVSLMTQPDGSSQGVGRGGPVVAHALRSEGADASEDGTGRGTPIIAFQESQSGFRETGSHPTLDGNMGSRRHHGVLAPTLRVGGREQGAGSSSDNTPIIAGTVRSHRRNNSNPTTEARGLVIETRPRRLTPRECERLQGFPDDWTLVDGASDSARYCALGNAVAVPVAEWILRRIPAETVGELFAGIGGFGLAAERAGKRVMWASEIDPFCRRVYAVRFPEVELFGDVRELVNGVLKAGGSDATAI